MSNVTTARAARVLILAIAACLLTLTACKAGAPGDLVLTKGVVAQRSRSWVCFSFCGWKNHRLTIRRDHRRSTIKVSPEIWKACPPKSAYPTCMNTK